MNTFFSPLSSFRMIAFFLGLIPFFAFAAPDTHQVLVSVAPYKFFVEKIAGDTVDVLLLVPAGTSAHTFEPSPKQMLAASQTAIWFRIGESFESRALPAFKYHNPEMMIVDLREGLDLIYASPCDHEHSCCHCTANGMDLHIWLSPRLAMRQAVTIAEALMERYPEYRDLYQIRLEFFLKELEALDREITVLLRPLKHRTILVSHPAYAYFCREYDLQQLSVEFEGKDPTPSQLTELLQRARANRNRFVYIQKEYSNKGAKLVAAELGAHVVMLDPYAEHYICSMRNLAKRFSEN